MPAWAQSRQLPTYSALITAVDTATFPEMNVYLAVQDATGQNIPSLPASAFTLAEDNSPVTRLSVSEEAVGAQVVFVLDTAPAFKARDANGVTRLERLKRALAEFVQREMEDGVDDFTVLAPEEALLAHSRQGGEVAAALNRYTTGYAGVADPFPLVSQALDFASDAAPRPGMRRYVVIFSNGLDAQAASLDDLAARASTAQVAIFTVFVGPAGDEVTTDARTLQKLAERGGGAQLIFDGPESLTPLFQAFAAQRTHYRLNYRSSLAVTGQHTLTAQVKLPDGQALASNEAGFPLRVEPPVVSLVNVPADILLKPAPTSADRGALEGSAAADPTAYALSVKVDYPDGHARRLHQAALWVDGRPTVTQSVTALDQFTWPLADYTQTGAHTLQAFVVDELGLAAQSGVLTVTVSLEIPAAGTAAASLPQSRGTWLPWLGALLTLGLVGGGGAWLWLSRRRRAVQAESVRPTLAVTQPFRPPASSRTSPTAPRISLPRLSLPRRASPAQPRGKAYLEVLVVGSGAAREAVEILGSSLKLGRDASVADVTFPERSVSRLHARIAEVSPGVFQILDEGSTSGTWVNFAQIPGESGQALKDGDVINLGRVQLRFKQREAPPARPVETQAEPAASKAQPPVPETRPENVREPVQPQSAVEEHKPR